MATKSGKGGKVQSGGADVAEVGKWSLKMVDSAPAYASSSTGGWKSRRTGVRDATGTFEAKLDPTNANKPPIDIGDAVTLNLFIDGTLSFTVPALISDMDYNCDIDTGDILAYTASFGVTGAITKPVYP